jgi:hypothetical protein
MTRSRKKEIWAVISFFRASVTPANPAFEHFGPRFLLRLYRNPMRLRATIPSVLFVAVFATAWASASQAQTDTATAQDELATPFNWPTIGVSEAGIQFSLRTRWEGGVLQYVVTLVDGKGRIAKWFSKHPDTGPIPFASFRVMFDDEEDFGIYTLYLHDRTFTKLEGTANWESKGENKCTEKIYRAALKAVKAKLPSNMTSHALGYPAELDAPSTTPKR